MVPLPCPLHSSAHMWCTPCASALQSASASCTPAVRYIIVLVHADVPWAHSSHPKPLARFAHGLPHPHALGTAACVSSPVYACLCECPPFSPDLRRLPEGWVACWASQSSALLGFRASLVADQWPVAVLPPARAALQFPHFVIWKLSSSSHEVERHVSITIVQGVPPNQPKPVTNRGRECERWFMAARRSPTRFICPLVQVLALALHPTKSSLRLVENEPRRLGCVAACSVCGGGGGGAGTQQRVY